ncbi:MAG TPA: glycosyltransferase family 2 protein [Sphingobium sp.]|nr:glycosyltransferase family 2 protein [Sphingobium sp.]
MPNWIIIIAGWMVAAPVLLVFGVLLTELVLGAKPGRRGAAPPPLAGVPSMVVLVPAHNEAAGIGRTIDSLLEELPHDARILVVADNCSDDTAATARAHGADVVERNDPVLRGKGHALAFGRDALRSDPPDAVLVVDADCTLGAGALAALGARALELDRPVQGLYLLNAGANAAPKVQISNFAFLIKNLVRQRGARRLGAPAILGGTGMAFPWRLFADLPLATSDLVEDLLLGIHCARLGSPPCFLESASVWSEAASEADTIKQRSRWEQGFLSTALSHGLPLLREGLLRPALLWTGLHLLVPPLALLFPIGFLALAVLVMLALLGGSWVPAALFGSVFCAVAVMIFVAWLLNGRWVIPARTFVRVPLYILWKAGIYFRFFARRGETEWVRTRRQGE